MLLRFRDLQADVDFGRGVFAFLDVRNAEAAVGHENRFRFVETARLDERLAVEEAAHRNLLHFGGKHFEEGGEIAVVARFDVGLERLLDNRFVGVVEGDGLRHRVGGFVDAARHAEQVAEGVERPRRVGGGKRLAQKVFRTFEIEAEEVVEAELEEGVPIGGVAAGDGFLQHVKPFVLNHVGRRRQFRIAFGHEAVLQEEQPVGLRLLRLAEIKMLGPFGGEALVFESAPAGALRNDFRGLEGEGLLRAGELLFELLARQHLVKIRGDFVDGGVPVAENLFRIGLDGAVGFEPFPSGLRRHGHAFALRAADAGLHFEIVFAFGGGQAALPVMAARALAPDEQLAAAEAVGGCLDEAVAVFVDGGFELAGFLRNVEELVEGVGVVRGDGDVEFAVVGDGDLREGALPAFDISMCERFLCGHDDALFLALRNGDVAPPVHRGDVDRVVHDADADVEEFRRFRQHEIKLVGDGAGAAEFVEAEDGRAVFVFRRGGEHGAAGQIMMAATADVPFDAARQPCVADGEILRLEDGIVRYQIAFCDFVEQLP